MGGRSVTRDVVHGRSYITDVNGDGNPDLLLPFNIQHTGIQCGDTFASLIGATFDGRLIQGSNAIQTEGCM
jgi:hypothetical protein